MARPGRVALYGGGGAPYHHAAILTRSRHQVGFVFPTDILRGALIGFDAFVMPGGGYRAMLGQIEPLGREGARAIQGFVRDGGLYLGCCAGSYCAATVPLSFTALCPVQGDLRLLDARIWNDGGEEWGGLQSPGVGVIRARTVNSGHPVMLGMPETFEITHYNGPFFTGGESLAVVEGPTERFTPAERFLGESRQPALIEEAARQRIPNIVAGSVGAGRVVLFGSHPEFGFTLAMDDEQVAARMLRNAVEWQLGESGYPERQAVRLYADGTDEPPAGMGRRVGEVTRCVRERVDRLRQRGAAPAWLQPAYALSIFSLSPLTIWQTALDEIDRLAARIEQQAPEVDPAVLAFRPPADWALDGGFWGVLSLVEQAEAMLGQALDRWEIDLGPPVDNPYAHAEASPYHLVAGSYLAAVGRMASAALLCEASALSGVVVNRT